MSLHRFLRPGYFALALAIVATGGSMVVAQDDDPEQGVASADSSGSYEVGGIEVDVTGRNADAARYAGWRLAQRKGWAQLAKRLGGGGSASDSTLDDMVSGIVVEDEQIGPNRYVARLGVLFSRARAGALLGIAGQAERSAPMLVVPIQWSGGTGQAFEQKTDWQEAWARYRTGNSAVDYIRPAGTGPDSLLLNTGQVLRPGRGWWRTILDQYGASDVLVPVVKLYRQWPGGPIIGVFEAHHGPDNRMVSKFTLRVDTGDGLSALLDAGVKRIDESYQNALRGGALNVDASLNYVPPPIAPVIVDLPTDDETPVAAPAQPVSEGTIVSIQFDTPGAASVSATEAAMRAIPGVRSALTSSLAFGGVSVMRVGFAGDPAALYAALTARGWQVQGSGTNLRIRRPGQPSQGATPVPPPSDNATGG